MEGRGVHTDSRIEQENGRFAVYLDILMEDTEGRPAGLQVKRIAEYPTRHKAEIAAQWFLRAARRRGPDPTGF